MKLKNSLFSKGLILSDLKRFWWLSALYFIALFCILPLNHLLLVKKLESDWYDKEWLAQMLKANLHFANQESFQVLLLLTAPVFTALLIFKYLHSTKATAALHALPLSRKSLLVNHLLAGFILLFVPVVFTGIALALVRWGASLQQYYPFMFIIRWMAINMLYSGLFFAITVFVGMFTGNSIAQSVFTYILNLLPLGIYYLLEYNFEELAYGYIGLNGPPLWIELLPMVKVLNLDLMNINLGQGVVYLLAGGLFLILAGYAYEKRPLEAAGEVVVFSIFRSIFKYGVTICFMLLGGVYFSEVYDNLFLGYFISSILAYTIAYTLLEKSLKIRWQSYKGYLVSMAVVVAVVALIIGDAFGYIGRIPEPQQVEEVYYGHNYGEWKYFTEKMAAKEDHLYYERNYSDVNFFTTEENIINIINLHKKIIEKPYYKKGNSRYIIYTLKNGKNIIRRYHVDQEYFAEELAPIYESQEYKEARFPILRQKDAAIKYVIIHNEDGEDIIINDREDIKELATALRQDIAGLKYSLMEEKGMREITVVDYKNKTINYDIRNSYTWTGNWFLKREL